MDVVYFFILSLLSNYRKECTIVAMTYEQKVHPYERQSNTS